MTLAVLMRRFPLGWREQEKASTEHSQCNVALAQQCLNFLPEPHGRGSFRPILGASRRKAVAEPRRRAPNSRSASK